MLGRIIGTLVLVAIAGYLLLEIFEPRYLDFILDLFAPFFGR